MTDGHVMISYWFVYVLFYIVHNVLSWKDSKEVVDRFYEYCEKNSDIKLWKDDKDGIRDHLTDDMASGIEDSRLVLAFASDGYFKSRNCHLEMNYAHTLAKEIIFVKQRDDLKLAGRGSISLIASGKLYVSVQVSKFP